MIVTARCMTLMTTCLNIVDKIAPRQRLSSEEALATTRFTALISPTFARLHAARLGLRYWLTMMMTLLCTAERPTLIGHFLSAEMLPHIAWTHLYNIQFIELFAQLRPQNVKTCLMCVILFVLLGAVGCKILRRLVRMPRSRRIIQATPITMERILWSIRSILFTKAVRQPCHTATAFGAWVVNFRPRQVMQPRPPRPRTGEVTREASWLRPLNALSALMQ